MKRPGDGFIKIDWHICPLCGKKGYYMFTGAILNPHHWRCKYCNYYGNKPKEDKQ